MACKFLAAVVASLAVAATGRAADQLVLGDAFVLVNPGGPQLRTAAASAEERKSTATVVGDPTLPGSAGGAILTLIANGASPSSQDFALPQGTTSSGDPFWRTITGGYRYRDLAGEQGPVRSVEIRKTSGGRFTIDSVAVGGLLVVVPPNPGTDAFMTLKLGLAPQAGDRYCVQYGPESDITNDGPFFFSAKNPVEKGCPPPPTTTTSTSTTTSTTSSTTSSTAVPTTTTTSSTMTSSTIRPCGVVDGVCGGACPLFQNCFQFPGGVDCFGRPEACRCHGSTSTCPPSTSTSSTTTTTSSTTTTTASTVCGNGIREPGEQCDGGPACTPDCNQIIASCCQAPGQCVTTPFSFSTFINVQNYCLSIAPPTYEPMTGEICQPDGSCSSLPIEPILVCCQRFDGSCEEGGPVSSTGALWVFHNSRCQGIGFGTTVPAATCAADGSCVPQ